MKKTNINLVPDCVNPSPDYYCTWQTQLYATCDGKPPKQRAIIGEKGLFETEKPYGWAYFYEQARRDLLLVMDDSWDVPPDGDLTYCGSLTLDAQKFPEATKNAKNNAEALKNLTDRIKSLGWKGLGGWVCAHETKREQDVVPEEYWTIRLEDAQKAGFMYWKVDWGKKAADFNFRKMLTDLGKEFAPDLIIEHAVIKEIIPYGDVYRTYDVPAIMSVPITMEKIKEFVTVGKSQKGRMGLINCEDEAYIAAAGGFTMGIMRHPYVGPFADGKADMSFPEVHRNLKTKMYEIIRAVRWHRIAPAFGVDAENTFIDENVLQDTWRFENKGEEMEEWWFGYTEIKSCIKDNVLTKSAPARISRNCKLPDVSKDEDGNVPYVLASRNPEGVFSVATLGRTMDRKYEIPKCDVGIDIGDCKTVGVFGEYKSLTIKTSGGKFNSVLMQDLAGSYAYDVTDEVIFGENEIILSGTLIHNIGTISQPETDTSESGLVVRLT